MPLTDPRAVWSLKCWCVKENFHSFMSMKKCQLSKRPARSQLAEVSLEFTDKCHRHPSDCGSKVLGQFEVFSFIPTPSLGPLWAKNNVYLLQSSYPFLGTGAECVLCSILFRFLVQEWSFDWISSSPITAFLSKPPPSFLTFGSLWIEERGREDRNIKAPL